MTTLSANRSSWRFSVPATPVILSMLVILVAGSGCASNLAINRGPLTGPFALAEPNGEFRLHATVTNGGDSSSAAAILEVCPFVSLADGTSAICPPLLEGWNGKRNCSVPALDPNQSRSFNFPILKGLCDKTHCCQGVVGLRLTDASGSPLTGQDTEMEVRFGKGGDLDGMKIVLPNDAEYIPLKFCEHQSSPSDCTK